MKSKMIGVFGNNDDEKDILRTIFESLGHEVTGRSSSVELEGVRIGLLHGDESNLLHEIIRSQAYDLVVSGHTHSIGQTRTGRTISFNPGEICGYLSGRATIATLETSTHRIEIFDV
jgi:putative phosphoesterase